MNCTTQPRYNNADYNAMMDVAKARAVQLRHEAAQEFWQLAGTVAGQGLRSAQRLAMRLARRAKRMANAKSASLNIEA